MSADVDWDRVVRAVERMAEARSEDTEAVSYALRSIACGDVTGPNGLELVAMSLGDGGGRSVAESVEVVASAIQCLAEAVDRIADHLEAPRP